MDRQTVRKVAALFPAQVVCGADPADVSVLSLAFTQKILRLAAWPASEIKCSSVSGEAVILPPPGHWPVTQQQQPLQACAAVGWRLCLANDSFPSWVHLPFPNGIDIVWQTSMAGCCHGYGYDVTRE